MEFRAHIKNLGAVEEATINVKPLTLIAGENASGKSFVTKGLYCLLEAMSKDYLTETISRNTRSIEMDLVTLDAMIKQPAAIDAQFIKEMTEQHLPQLAKLADLSRDANFAQQQELLPASPNPLTSLLNRLRDYRHQRARVARMAKAVEVVDSIIKAAEEIQAHFSHAKSAVTQRIKDQVADNLKHNLQITNLAALINHNTRQAASVSIDALGTLNINMQGGVDFSLKSDGLQEVQQLQKVIFIDSPVYLNIQKGLTRKRVGLWAARRLKEDRYLQGYPRYVDQLYSLIGEQYIDEPDFQEISEEIQSLLNGRLTLSQSGELVYTASTGQQSPLSLTAMGVCNLGLIELLLRNNLINKGAFLIIDEPEAHVHPKWQVALMDILYKIAKAGANVIIATHSIDMAKKTELLMKRDSIAKEIISVNKMPSSKLPSTADELDKIAEVLEDLSTPFYEMYLQGI
ncbi:AAA family ATPase [Ectothiorhodospira marina]|uniref:AAA ATPase domain-containing protein n=1 Tax=Ectothiorhodospira marina TaxID=1396821 RepID=A0A1H7M4R3_9GAMM|nr:AAA family ATPase [Ectothiorhodospira marina]SEL05577.1 AAA ATPase domain-containing protein [Ectothiorhodospira marina]